MATCVALDTADHAAVVAWCRANAIRFVVIGPEIPLVAGLADDLAAAGIAHFGPSKAAARLEGSKGFTKDLCAELGIPTAAYGRFRDAASAKAYLAHHGAPIVVKADGLAAGKGVIMAETLEQAHAGIDACFSGDFGASGAEIVLEEWMQGEEASFFALVDGTTAVALPSAQDHKRVGDGDTGPNTGGMGAYSPAPVFTPELQARVMAEIIEPTVAVMQAQGMPYSGVLFAGLMLTPSGPRLIEYNARFGDPECQVLMMRLDSDLAELLLACAEGRLAAIAPPRFSDDTALTVVMAAEGYPGVPKKGGRVAGIATAEADGAKVFHAGTAPGADGGLTANGGRVLNVTARGASVLEAQTRAYAAVAKIDFPEGFCRSDIGWREVEREGQG